MGMNDVVHLCVYVFVYTNIACRLSEFLLPLMYFLLREVFIFIIFIVIIISIFITIIIFIIIIFIVLSVFLLTTSTAQPLPPPLFSSLSPSQWVSLELFMAVR